MNPKLDPVDIDQATKSEVWRLVSFKDIISGVAEEVRYPIHWEIELKLPTPAYNLSLLSQIIQAVTNAKNGTLTPNSPEAQFLWDLWLQSCQEARRSAWGSINTHPASQMSVAAYAALRTVAN